MYGGASPETHRSTGPAGPQQAVEVADVEVDRLGRRREAGRSRRDDHARPRPGQAGGVRGPEIAREIRLTQRNAGDARRRRDGERVLDSESRFDQAAQRRRPSRQRIGNQRDVGWRRDLGHPDGAQRGHVRNGGEVVAAGGGVGTVHPNLDAGGRCVGQECQCLAPSPILVVGGDGVLEIDDDDVRTARHGLREALGPVARDVQEGQWMVHTTPAARSRAT